MIALLLAGCFLGSTETLEEAVQQQHWQIATQQTDDSSLKRVFHHLQTNQEEKRRLHAAIVERYQSSTDDAHQRIFRSITTQDRPTKNPPTPSAERYTAQFQQWSEVTLGASKSRWQVVRRAVDIELVSAPDWTVADAAASKRATELWTLEGVKSKGFAQGEPPKGSVEEVMDGLIAAGFTEDLAVAEAASAALTALDPYTKAIWPGEIAQFNQYHGGVVVGVGLEIDTIKGELLLVSLAERGPSWRSGLHVGDVLLSVGKKTVSGLGLEQVRLMLSGEPGTSVVTTWQRGGEVALTRASYSVPTVFGWEKASDGWNPWLDEENKIAYVGVSTMKPQTVEEFVSFFDGIEEQVKGVVLDLRANGGGDVMVSLQLADQFVDGGVLAGADGRVGPPEPEPGQVPWYAAIEESFLEQVPVVVLVNSTTASAAEILAACLRERRDAPLFGAATYGKGWAQALRADEEAQVAWQVTNFWWTSPSGARLPSTGLTPDVEVLVSLPADFSRRMAARKRQQSPTHADGSPMPYLGMWPNEELPTTTEDEVALLAWLHLLKGHDEQH